MVDPEGDGFTYAEVLDTESFVGTRLFYGESALNDAGYIIDNGSGASELFEWTHTDDQGKYHYAPCPNKVAHDIDGILP